MADTRIDFENFGGGVTSDPDPSQITPRELRAGLNLFIAARGTLRLRTGQHNVIPTQANVVQGFTRYRNASIARLIRAQNGTIIARDEGSGTDTLLTNDGISPGDIVEFAKLYDYAFWVNGAGPPVFWRGTGTAAQNAGILPPGISAGSATVTLRNDPASKMQFGPVPIQYYVAFADATGVLSEPKLLAQVDQEDTTDTFQVALAGIYTSAEARVTARWIYRSGGQLAVPVRVAVIADNTTLTYTDNLPDINAGTIGLPSYNMYPPLGAQLIAAHKNRLVLATKFRVYLSSLGQPEYFPILPADDYVDGKYFDVDPDLENPIVALSSTGSLLVIARRKNIYTLTGDDVPSWSLNKVCDIGCAARRSMVMCGNLAVWLAPDGEVYSLPGEGRPVRMSDAVTNRLRGLSQTILAGACAAYHRGRYILCVPQPSGSTSTPIVLAMDFRHPVGDPITGEVRYAWEDLSGRYMAGTQLYGETGQGDANELLLATDTNYLQPDGTAYTGIVSALNPADTTTDLPLDAWSGDMVFDRRDWLKKLTHITVRGTGTPKAGTTPTLKLYADDNLLQTFNLTGFTLPNTTLLEEEVDAACVGQRLSWRLEGQARAFEIISVSLGWNYVRQVKVKPS